MLLLPGTRNSGITFLKNWKWRRQERVPWNEQRNGFHKIKEPNLPKTHNACLQGTLYVLGQAYQLLSGLI